MSTYILAFSDAHALDEVLAGVRDATEDVPAIAVDRGWQQPGDPGQYVTLQAQSPDELRRVLGTTEFEVEGIVELVRKPSEHDLFVHRADAINDAFEVYGYAPETLYWCDECTVAHRKGRHVR